MNRKSHDALLALIQHALVIAFEAKVAITPGARFAADTIAGQLTGCIQAGFQINRVKWETPWVHLRFEDVAKAREYFGIDSIGYRLNPYSGKWNWHPDDAAQLMHMETAIKALHPTNFTIDPT